MPLLWSPVWYTSPDFRVGRGRLCQLIVGWNPGIFITTGNPLIIRETPFGGYRFVVKLNSRFWTPNSKMWRLQDLFEDVYVIEPGSGTLVNAGPVTVRVGVGDPNYQEAIVLDMASVLPTYYFIATPEMPNSYWNKDTRRWKRTPPFKYVP